MKYLATALLMVSAFCAQAQRALDKQLEKMQVPKEMRQDTVMIVSPYAADSKKWDKFSEAVAGYTGKKIVVAAHKAMPSQADIEKAKRYRYVLTFTEEGSMAQGFTPAQSYFAKDYVVTLLDNQDPKVLAIRAKLEPFLKSGDQKALIKAMEKITEAEVPKPLLDITIERNWEEGLRKVMARIDELTR